MGCGLRKLEDPDDSSPGKIFSTLKRPQVETKTDSAYEYILLDFTLEGSWIQSCPPTTGRLFPFLATSQNSMETPTGANMEAMKSSSSTRDVISNPEIIKICSVLDIAKNVEEYYNKGYVVGAIHPVLLSSGQRRHFPASHIYRVVLVRLKFSHKNPPMREPRPRLVIEECPLTYEKLTNEAVKEVLEKVNDAAKRGMKFVGFITQSCSQSKICNGTNPGEDTESDSTLCRRNREQRSHDSEDNVRIWNEGTLSGQSSESGIQEEIQLDVRPAQKTDFQEGIEGCPSPNKLKEKEDTKLYTVFNVFEDDSISWTYHDSILSLKVSRKGPVISTLDADWLDLTTFYYKQGLSLIDSFVCWKASKADFGLKSLEGLFIYEEELGFPGSERKGNDAIVVEQWTVIEGSEIKTDYGPLLHTLAEFGWLLTCVLPTPVIRLDSEGNLATKQVVFLQRPAMGNPAVQIPEKKTTKQFEEKLNIRSGKVGSDTATSQPVQHMQPTEEFHIAPSPQCWPKDESAQYGSFPAFKSSDGMLRELEEGQFDQEDGVTQVTCM